MMENESVTAITRPQRRAFKRRRVMRANLSPAQFNHLLRAADHRGVAPNVLVDRIVGTVLDHNLINAVLDD